MQPIADSVGVEILEAKWSMRGGERKLEIYIDAAGGVDLNLCEAFHRAIDDPLDELDPTYGAAYTLSCSSAGLDRPFKTERDYARHIGERIEIHLYAPIDGKKRFEGELISCEKGIVVVEAGEERKEFPLEKIAKACLSIEI